MTAPAPELAVEVLYSATLIARSLGFAGQNVGPSPFRALDIGGSAGAPMKVL